MFRTMLKSKIHRLRITDTQLYYEGSITIDAELLKKAGILPYEKVEVLNLNNGSRIETYAIKGNQAEVCLNGPAAKHGSVGDEVIILTYVQVKEKDAIKIKPKIVYVDEQNRIKS